LLLCCMVERPVFCNWLFSTGFPPDKSLSIKAANPPPGHRILLNKIAIFSKPKGNMQKIVQIINEKIQIVETTDSLVFPRILIFGSAV